MDSTTRKSEIDIYLKTRTDLSIFETTSYSPLTYDDTLPTTEITNIVLIEQGFPDFQSYVNEHSFAIMYNPDSTMTDLSAVLHQKFSSLKRIAVVSHYNPTPTFIDSAPLFDLEDILPGTTTYSQNVLGLIRILRDFNVTNIDFLACNSLLDQNWVAFFSILQARVGVVVGASSDDTGNIKYGGNWMMENTHEYIQTIYFNSSISEYASLLATKWVAYPFGILNYSYTAGVMGTAILISVTGTLTGAVVIPPFMTDASGVDHAIVGMTATFQNQLLVTSVVIMAPITSTPNNLFNGCITLSSVIFPDTITSLGTYCFIECQLLTSFNWPTLITTIPSYFFAMNKYLSYNMTYVTPLIIPNRITNIGTFAFVFLGNIPSIYVPPNCTLSNMSFYLLIGVKDVICYSIGNLPAYAFGVLTGMVNLTFGPGITSINWEAIVWSNSLKSIVLPSTLLSLDMGFVTYTLSLKKISIPVSVTTISSTAVQTPYSPQSMTIEFMHETNFPTVTLAQRLPLNSAIRVSNKVKLMSNYLTMVSRLTSDITVTGVSTVNFFQYISAIPITSSTTVTLTSLSTADLGDANIIGSTDSEKKIFTSNSVSALFGVNTAQKQLILQAGSVLPGFSSSLTKPVYLYNASATVANCKITRLTKASILDLDFYVLMNSGDSIVVETNSDTVNISKNMSTFTLVTGKGVTSTMSIGNTYVYDGLSLLLGSLYGGLRSTSVNIVLTALNSALTLNKSGTIPSYGPMLTSDATITLTGGITEYEAQNTFFFRTDEQICLDASFVAYYVDISKWPTNLQVLSPKNGTVTSNYYVNGDGVGKDFLRDIARQLFGTYLAADLFTNEDSVVSDINTKCDQVATVISLLLHSIDKKDGTLSGLTSDSSGNFRFKDNETTSNISREIFNEMITKAPTRFNDMTIFEYHAGINDGFYRLPFLAGDTISYKVTIGSSSDQTTAVPTGKTTTNPRTYTVTLKVI